MSLSIRPIAPGDAETLALLHATSWRSAYRGILRDEYLDYEVVSDRKAVWSERLIAMPPSHFGHLATIAGRPVGFIYARGDDDPAWGTLLDNIHVLPEVKRQGLGRRLIAAMCREAQIRHLDAGVFLWVFEQNDQARRFYARLGGESVERVVTEAPGGGEIAEWRVAWRSPAQLMLAAERGEA